MNLNFSPGATEFARISHQRITAHLQQMQNEATTAKNADAGLALGQASGRLLQLRQQHDLVSMNVTIGAQLEPRLEAIQGALASIAKSFSSISNLHVMPGVTKAVATETSQSALDQMRLQLKGSFGGEDMFRGASTLNIDVLEGQFESDFSAQFGIQPSDPAAASIQPEDIASFAQAEISRLADLMPPPGVHSARIDLGVGSSLRTIDAGDQHLRKAIAETFLIQKISRSAIDEAGVKAMLSGVQQTTFDIGDGLREIQSRLAYNQETLRQVNQANTRRAASLEQEAGMLENVDVYETATRMNQTMNQLDASYRMLARLQDLTITKYI